MDRIKENENKNNYLKTKIDEYNRSQLTTNNNKLKRDIKKKTNTTNDSHTILALLPSSLPLHGARIRPSNCCKQLLFYGRRI